MEGTWGRRVFGRVMKGDTNTVFILEIEMGDGVHRRVASIPSEELLRIPGSYKKILDELTFQLELEIKPKHKEMDSWQ